MRWYSIKKDNRKFSIVTYQFILDTLNDAIQHPNDFNMYFLTNTIDSYLKDIKSIEDKKRLEVIRRVAIKKQIKTYEMP